MHLVIVDAFVAFLAMRHMIQLLSQACEADLLQLSEFIRVLVFELCADFLNNVVLVLNIFLLYVPRVRKEETHHRNEYDDVNEKSCNHEYVDVFY
jgi:hypothetical protein